MPKTKLFLIKLLLLQLFLLLSICSLAQEIQQLTPKAALENILTKEITEIQFAESFLQAVSLEQIKQIIAQLSEQLGNYQQINGKAPEFVVIFEKGSAITRIVLDSEGKIAGLLFTELIPEVVDLKTTLDNFKTLQDEISLFVLRFDPQLGDNKVLADINADKVLAVGSSFKLAILVSLQDKISEGDLKWTDVVKLKPQWQSLPSGILQDWPVGSQLTLESLATLMISVSDNTAADTLIGTLGIEAIEKSLEERNIKGNIPFLNTRAFFTLKAKSNADLLANYIKGDAEIKRTAITSSLKRKLPPLSELYTEGKPVALEVEWFFSNRELCKLMREVQYLPLMSINNGLANKKSWQRIAFKGGSEPGVINLTSWLVSENGLQYCVSLTQNRPNDEAQEAQVFTIYRGILEVLKSSNFP